MKFVTELCHYLASWLTDLRRARAHAAALEVETLQDIAADIDREAAARRQTAFKARCLDDEGLALLDRITAPSSPGGALIVRAELPAYRRAVRFITRSRELDHALSEAGSLPDLKPHASPLNPQLS